MKSVAAKLRAYEREPHQNRPRIFQQGTAAAGWQMKSNLDIRLEPSAAEPAPVKPAQVMSAQVVAPSGFSSEAAFDPAGARQDASALQGLLAEKYTKSKEADKPQDADAKAAKPGRFGKPLSPWQSRLLKSVVGLIILVSAGMMPVQRLFQVSSVEAVVNAHVVTLRAPIGGVVAQGPQTMRVGAPVAQGNLLMTVENARADHNAIERATEELQSTKEDLAATAARIERLAALRSVIATRVEHYRADRIRRLDANIAIADARIESARAVVTRAEAELVRQTTLAASGISADAMRQTAVRDLAVARSALDQARSQKAALTIEAKALQAERFFGDGYDDVPRSAQRLDEIDANLASLAADRAKFEARVERLTAGLRSERARFELASQAAIAAPAGGQVWEMLTSPGEQVVAGQPLVSVLDCSRLMVTAAVSEAVYNSLSIGAPASFTLRESGQTFAGHVVQLSGVSAAGSNFAIVPSALTKESYRVTVAADNLSSGGACPVGQTGRVVFGKAAS